jgi:chaperonin GroEL
MLFTLLAQQLKKALFLAVVLLTYARLKALEKMECSAEEKIGVQIVARAVEAPIRTIVSNAGHEASVVVDKIKNSEGSVGFNALTETVEDLVKAGVIDPTKVARSALQNAGSVAGSDAHN